MIREPPKPHPKNGVADGLDNRKLTYFIAVAEELCFRSAASKVGVSQAAISEQVKALESNLEVQLFERRGRQVRLTQAGVTLLNHARKIASLEREARQDIQQVVDLGAGHLTVGFVSLANYNVLPASVRRFRVAYPGVRLVLWEATTDIQAVEIAEGRMDIGFVVPPVSDRRLVYDQITREPLVLAVPANSPLGKAERAVSLSEVADMNFVLFPRAFGPGLYDQILEYCRGAGFSPKVLQEAVQMQTIVSLVAGGLGVSLVPASICKLMREGVAYKSIIESSPMVEMGTLHRKDHLAISAKAFLRIVREEVAPQN